MKRPITLITLLGSATLFISAAVAAQPGPKARIFAKYDTNKNGVIDGDEVAEVRKAFAADPKGEFAIYDVNHDGKLDDQEIAAIKPPGQGGKKGERKEGGGKKSSNADTKTDAK